MIVKLDLVIPVHNALRATRDCLRTVRAFAPSWARVVVINDGSDARTTEWLREQEGITLLENPVNLGFVQTANRGLLFSDSPYVCLLNSDTLLTPGALERMVERLEREPAIGMCCPLSNSAVNLSVRIPPGDDVFSFARRVALRTPGLYPDVTTVVGFCLLVRREVLTTLGVLDEAYGRGYCEETDLHLRARAAGWRCVIADDVFVYHRQGASFSDSQARFEKNVELLMARWKHLYETELEEFNRRNELAAVRDAATFEWTGGGAREPFDVLFVLPMMGVFGGVADVLELANALVLEGLHAGVVVLEDSPREIDLELFFTPLRLPLARFADELPETRVLVATAYQTAPPVALAGARRPGMKTAYFLQDYEGWFGGDPVDVVAQTYDLVPNMTAISTWLAEEIAERHGHRAAVVPMSGDPEVFYPRGDRADSGPVRVVAMLRYEERRGFRYLLPALRAVSAHPEIEIVLFGAHRFEEENFPHTHVGVLSRDGVARLLSTAHIVVDPSLFQGFGLVGLEAMASGAACVLTDSGGVMEYARHEENALVVPPRDEQALAAAILRLADDRQLRERLARSGLATARTFTWQRSAEAFVAFLRALPEPPPVSSGERAALEIYWRELQRDRAEIDALAEALAASRETLATIQKSTLWRAAEPYWRWKARLTRALVWTALAGALWACHPAPQAPTSAVLVSIDTLRPDHLGCYGYSAPTSPEIDRLCAESSVYTGALAHAPSTLLSHASMFTSLVPQHHGASHLRRLPLPAGVATLAESFAGEGFRTAGFHGGAQLAPEFGFGRGFERYEERTVPLAAVVPEALAWLDSVGAAPFFLFLHTYDVHHPYTPAAASLQRFDSDYGGTLPPSISVELLWDAKRGRVVFDEADRRHIVAAYDAEIREMDAAVGALLAGLRQRGLLDRTVFALTSDHGEEFGEHGAVGWHSHTLFQELLRVPLVLRLPDRRGAGLRPAERVGLIDLAPTLLAAAGVPSAPGSQGRSLLPLLDPPSRARSKAAAALAERPFLALGEVAEGSFEALLLGAHKLYGGALFDLDRDPQEKVDIAGQSPREVAALSALLTHLSRTDEPGARTPLTLDEETERGLRALGYLR
jgi:O-antigen biosynthesis protein